MSEPVILPPAHTTTRRFPWWVPLSVGVLVIAAGVGLLVWPFVAASWLLAMFFGAALIANGLALMVRSKATGASFTGGIVLLLVGLFAIVFSDFTVNALVMFVGVTLIAVGSFWLVIALALSRGGLGAALPGIVMVLGGVATIAWPQVALSFVAVIAGLVMLAVGAVIIWGAYRMRSVTVTQFLGSLS